MITAASMSVLADVVGVGVLRTTVLLGPHPTNSDKAIASSAAASRIIMNRVLI